MTDDTRKIGHFLFKSFDNGHFLLTNDTGAYCFLTQKDFADFLNKRIKKSNPIKFQELNDRGFFYSAETLTDLIKKYAAKHSYLAHHGPSLHIIVVTLKCDHRCLYCQSSAQDITAGESDMNIKTAQKVVERIFETPNKNILIEFQGGEPLANWKVVKFAIKYAVSLNKKTKKNLLFTLVTNFTFMTEDRLHFLLDNNITLCSSLDGSEILHNKNRPTTSPGGNSYKNTTFWLRKINALLKKHKTYNYKLNALTTITKTSLKYPYQIIDEFLSLGLRGIFLRPMCPLGMGKSAWKTEGFSAGEFLKFYGTALDKILEANKKDRVFLERTAQVFLSKILKQEDSNYLDIRSPCGAGIGQLAYNYNGDVYTCDEGRMLAKTGDEIFKLGNVHKNSFREWINHTTVAALSAASCLENLPGCHQCVYKPYCGVCPVYNYATGGDIVGKTINERCKIHQGILDKLFTLLLKSPKNERIFQTWLTN